MDRAPEGTERHQVSDSLPKGMERRLVLRLLAYWRGLCDDGVLPSFVSVDPAEMDDMWPFCFVLDVAGHEDDPVFRRIGEAIGAHSTVDLVDRPISQAVSDTLIGASVSYAHEVIDKQVPISRGGEFYKYDGTKVFYRSIVLPMSDDGTTVSGLLCAANCREVHEG